MRNRLAALNLVESFADGGKKFNPFSDDIEAHVIRQTFDCLQNQLLVTHATRR